jgi:tripartite-type tricarboxylate transporter receptor subunit TctC
MLPNIASTIRGLASVLTISVAVNWCAPVQAEDYPTRVIRIVVPYPAGGTSEVLARLMAKKMGEDFGQPVVIDNVGGASGTIGATRVANATADGYSLLFGYATQFTIAPAIQAGLSYDPVKSFIPLGGVARFPFLITAFSAMPFNTMSEFVAYAKKNPGKLTYASPGIGTSTHMIGELIKLKYGVDLLHVPYRGGGAAITDYVAGRISVYWDAVAPLTPWVKQGTIKPLAVTSEKRFAEFADVPTVAEAGTPDLNVSTWTALFAPAGTPKEIVAKLEAELAKLMKDKELQDLFERNQYEAFSVSAGEVAKLIQTDLAKWRAVAEAAKIKVE